MMAFLKSTILGCALGAMMLLPGAIAALCDTDLVQGMTCDSAGIIAYTPNGPSTSITQEQCFTAVISQALDGCAEIRADGTCYYAPGGVATAGGDGSAVVCDGVPPPYCTVASEAAKKCGPPDAGNGPFVRAYDGIATVELAQAACGQYTSPAETLSGCCTVFGTAGDYGAVWYTDVFTFVDDITDPTALSFFCGDDVPTMSPTMSPTVSPTTSSPPAKTGKDGKGKKGEGKKGKGSGSGSGKGKGGKGKGGKLAATNDSTQHSVVGVAVMGVVGVAVGVAALAVRKNRMTAGYIAVDEITNVMPAFDSTENTPLVAV